MIICRSLIKNPFFENTVDTYESFIKDKKINRTFAFYKFEKSDDNASYVILPIKGLNIPLEGLNNSIPDIHIPKKRFATPDCIVLLLTCSLDISFSE